MLNLFISGNLIIAPWSFLCRCRLLLCFFSFCAYSLPGQSVQAQSRLLFPNSAFGDTNLFHQLFTRFQEEVALRGYANLDTSKTFGHAALREAQRVGYSRGLIQVYLGFGSTYISKINVDSAKYYYTLATWQSNSIQDTQLLARSYLGYGYALVYDHSDYESAIRLTQKGYELSKAIKDTSLLIDANSRLVAIYELSQDLLSAYKSCSELFQISLARRDTTAIINNYYMLGSLYSNLNLFEKQMQIVHRTIAFLNYTKDTTSLYTIYRTAADGYLSTQQYDSVLYYARINLPFCKKLNKLTNGYGYLGKAYLETNQLDSAKYYYNKILDEQKSNGMYIDTYEYLDLGQIEFKLGHFAKAYEYYRIAETNIERPSLSTQKEIYKALSVYFNYFQNYQAALSYLEKHNQVVEQINSNQATVSVNEFESQKLNAEIQLLTKDKALQASLSARHAQQKNIAYSGIAIILFASGWGFIRYKKQKDLKNKQVLLQERLRISRELHDEVGSTLSGIAMYSHLVNQQLSSHDISKAQQSLIIIQQSAKSMISKLSDIIWLINPEQESLEILIHRVREYGRQMTQAKNIKLEFDVPPNLSKLTMSMEARRHIFLFCKESINNAVKYSGGSTLKVAAVFDGNQVKFSVSDNGVGFDELKVRKGNGLKNMEHRAASLGGKFHIDSAPDQGSTINLQYNLTQ